MQWFRMYHETINDTKIRRLSRLAKTNKATIIGLWTIILSMASESPERGRMLLSEDMPVMEDDIVEISGLPLNEVTSIMLNMMYLGMLDFDEDDGIYSVANWDSRQFKSDSPNERVKRYRKRKSKEQSKEDVTLHGNGDVTLQKRYCNTPETDTDTDTEVASSEASLLSMYMDATGETRNPPLKFKEWFSDVTDRYSRSDCVLAFEKMRKDIQASNLNGASKWERCVWHLENPHPSGQPIIVEVPAGVNSEPWL